MNQGNIRIGTVSSVDTKTGMVSVIYEDRDGEVTGLLPYATFNDEYKLPKIGAKVIVLHLSNGKEMGIVLGTFWNEANIGKKGGAYHKDIGEDAYLDYDNKTLIIAAKHIHLISLDDKENFITIDDLIEMKRRLGMTQGGVDGWHPSDI